MAADAFAAARLRAAQAEEAAWSRTIQAHERAQQGVLEAALEELASRLARKVPATKKGQTACDTAGIAAQLDAIARLTHSSAQAIARQHGATRASRPRNVNSVLHWPDAASPWYQITTLLFPCLCAPRICASRHVAPAILSRSRHNNGDSSSTRTHIRSLQNRGQ
jgi:hypothetical protein